MSEAESNHGEMLCDQLRHAERPRCSAPALPSSAAPSRSPRPVDELWSRTAERNSRAGSSRIPTRGLSYFIASNTPPNSHSKAELLCKRIFDCLFSRQAADRCIVVIWRQLAAPLNGNLRSCMCTRHRVRHARMRCHTSHLTPMYSLLLRTSQPAGDSDRAIQPVACRYSQH